MADADLLRVLGDGGEHQLGRGAVAELDRGVMLDLPPAAVPHLVRQPGLLERLLEDPVLVLPVVAPQHLRVLHLGENVDLHRRAALPESVIGGQITLGRAAGVAADGAERAALAKGEGAGAVRAARPERGDPAQPPQRRRLANGPDRAARTLRDRPNDWSKRGDHLDIQLRTSVPVQSATERLCWSMAVSPPGAVFAGALRLVVGLADPLTPTPLSPTERGSRQRGGRRSPARVFAAALG